MTPTNVTSETTQSIVVDYDLPEPPEKVWRALTEPALLSAWLMSNDIQPVVGHNFTFHAQPVPGWDGVVHCTVMAVEPTKRLKYSWKGGSDDLKEYGHTIDTTVTWTLSPTPEGGTSLRLEHAGFTPADAFPFQMMGQGWRGNVAKAIGRVLAEL